MFSLTPWQTVREWAGLIIGGLAALFLAAVVVNVVWTSATRSPPPPTGPWYIWVTTPDHDGPISAIVNGPYHTRVECLIAEGGDDHDEYSCKQTAAAR